MSDPRHSGWTAPDRPGDPRLRPSAPPPPGAYPGTYPGEGPDGPPRPYYLYPQPVPGVALAEIWQRLLANVIDQAVFSTISGVLVFPVWLVVLLNSDDTFPRPDETTRPGDGAEFPVEIFVLYGVLVGAILVLLFAYQTVSVAIWGGTIGKKALKLEVVRVADGGKVGWGQAAGRAGTTVFFTLLPCIGYLDPMWLLWDKPNRRALHDKAAGTVVVRTDYAPVGERAVFTG